MGFYELNDHFMESFVPDGGELQKEPGQLYLNLKTQMYLSALSSEEQEKTTEETLNDLFPANLAEILRARHPQMELTQAELEFINDSNARKQYLQNDSGDETTIGMFSSVQICFNERAPEKRERARMSLAILTVDSCNVRTIRLGGFSSQPERPP